MMKQYIADAFTDRIFSGNPAAVCLPDAWPTDLLMQQLAKENNLSETAFAVREGADYRLRWFTPAGEIDLCGHATLATAFVILTEKEPQADTVRFHTKSGLLTVRRSGEYFEMDFPAYPLPPVPVTEAMTDALGIRPQEAYLARDLLLILGSEEDVRKLKPDMEKLAALDGLSVGVTAKGSGYDCVSRVFGPKCGIPEDPVTGSTHCMIAPYWAEKLGKDTLLAWQASARGGELRCRVAGDRVTLSGKAVLFSVAELNL